MTDYIKHKEYKLPDGSTVAANFNESGQVFVTIEAMDALFDILNSSDVVEVVRCKDCIHKMEDNYSDGNVPDLICKEWDSGVDAYDYCSYGEKE